MKSLVSSEMKRKVTKEDDEGDETETRINVEDLSEQGVTFEAPLKTQEIISLPVEFVSVPMEGSIIEVRLYYIPLKTGKFKCNLNCHRDQMFKSLHFYQTFDYCLVRNQEIRIIC